MLVRELLAWNHQMIFFVSSGSFIPRTSPQEKPWGKLMIHTLLFAVVVITIYSIRLSWWLVPLTVTSTGNLNLSKLARTEGEWVWSGSRETASYSPMCCHNVMTSRSPTVIDIACGSCFRHPWCSVTVQHCTYGGIRERRGDQNHSPHHQLAGESQLGLVHFSPW